MESTKEIMSKITYGCIHSGRIWNDILTVLHFKVISNGTIFEKIGTDESNFLYVEGKKYSLYSNW